MPRTAVCVDIVQNAGHGVSRRYADPRFTHGALRSNQPRRSAAERFPGHVAPRFIYRMAQSENLLPFVLGDHRAPLGFAGSRDAAGAWSILDETEIRRMGFTQTARRFAAINQKLKTVGKGKTLQQRIDERGKLSKQVFGTTGYLILAGAGGKISARRAFRWRRPRILSSIRPSTGRSWPDADEAWYQVGMLNSVALTNATLAFNPKGDFGERHLHTLPYRMMPAYDAGNGDHRKIAVLAKDIAILAEGHCTTDPYLADPPKH